MQFVKGFQSLSIASLLNYLSRCQAPFQSSNVYEVATKARKIDSSLRSSKFRSLKDPELFDICSQIVQTIADSDLTI